MPSRVRLYIGFTTALALVAAIGWTRADPPQGCWPWLGGLVMVIACVFLERRAARMPGGNTVSIATIPHLAGIFLLPPPMAIAAAAIGMLIDQAWLREPPLRVTFNTANTAATVGITALLADVLSVRGADLVDGGFDEVGRLFLVILAYYVVNSGLLAGVMALAARRPLAGVWWLSARYSAPAEVAVAVIGGLAVFVWLTNPAWLPAVLFPMLVAQLTLDYLAATDRKTRELEHQAYHDSLTGLPNRMALHRDLTHALASQGPSTARPALLMMDLDRFKEVNDTFGHLHGDALLREVAGRLKHCVAERGEVARLGGDEFAVLLRATNAATAEEVAHDVLRALATPLRVDGVALFVAASIGIAIGADHEVDPEAVLRRADVAMYAAKEGRAGVAHYNSDLDSHDRERLALLHDFHQALTEGTLQLAYQPKICARTREMHSVEALLRWQHPVNGFVSPAVFVPLAEQAGLSGPLVRWVLDTALRQSREWQEQGRHIPICVNISMYDLRDDTFPDLVAERLNAHNASANLLSIEVTESAAMADPVRTRIALDRLRALGVRVAIDDFGTGYASLAYLVALPVDELKIDRSFVVGMELSAQHAAVVRSTISLGHDLDLTVVAEGVEDDGTWQRLRSFGCDLIQGYVVSRPLPAAQLLEWLDGRATRTQPALVA